jgi:hypothetical protein
MAICESKPPKCFSLVDLNVVMKRLLPVWHPRSSRLFPATIIIKVSSAGSFDLVDGIAIECGEN